MDQVQKEELSRDLWRFMILGSFLYSMFYTIAEKIVAVERLPFRYFVLSGVLAFAVEAALYFSIRNWPGRRKTAVVWVIGFLWIGVCLFVN
ncbi:hypothetical protein SAMN05216327_11882 [Dyadobacter sp. SG02]|uniref:hypothetical protein n=1 Tax=Dyadobacter sp. SG02 TaxID=1855291 RepID=UPI0008CFDB2A|nr:hypothetical protein [Dyadobacter sp. SG02]SEJ75086.1 hypothetical protein SAMN05216327_11882 [Dyadobacter sp. SG02]